MGFSLLAPLFLAGLAAVAVPILVHLTARDRRDVLRFPSLKFLTRLPYRQARRQRLRHRFLFALRTLAVVLLVLAFTRPFFDGAATGVVAGRGREVVIALDLSYSMAYKDTWERALEAVRDTAMALPAGSRSSLVTFETDAAIQVDPTTDPQAVTRALEGLTPGSGSTRFAPALRLAREIMLDSPLAEREVVLISDLQAAGWERATAGGSDMAILPADVELTLVDSSAASGDTPTNALISGVATRQTRDDAGTHMTVIPRLANLGTEMLANLPVTVDLAAATAGESIDGVEDQIDLAPSQSTTMTLGPIDLPPGFARVTVRLGDDPLLADNAFHLTVRPRSSTPVLLLEAPDARDDASLYLREALAVPPAEQELRLPSAFDLRVKHTPEATPADIEAARVVVIHDSPFPTGTTGRALADHVAAGGGLWCVLGSRSELPGEGLAALLPGRWRDTVDRLNGRGSGLAGIDYDHPVFRIFAGSGDGNLAAPRLYRYRPIELTGGTAVAHTTEGTVALAERRVGKGSVLLWSSPFDNRWSDLPLQAVFLPFVHQVIRHLAGERAMEPWHQVGQVLDLRALVGASGVEIPDAGTAVVKTPSGREYELPWGSTSPESKPPSLPLDEAGFYEVAPTPGQPRLVAAVNVDPTESDLTKLDAKAFAAASTAEVGAGSAAGSVASHRLTREQRERRQGLWWFLLFSVLLLLAAESLWSNMLLTDD